MRGTIVSDRVAMRLARRGAGSARRALSPPRAAPLLALLVRPAAAELRGFAPLSAAELDATQRRSRRRHALYKNPLAHLAVIVAGTHPPGVAESLLPRQPDL